MPFFSCIVEPTNYYYFDPSGVSPKVFITAAKVNPTNDISGLAKVLVLHICFSSLAKSMFWVSDTQNLARHRQQINIKQIKIHNCVYSLKSRQMVLVGQMEVKHMEVKSERKIHNFIRRCNTRLPCLVRTV